VCALFPAKIGFRDWAFGSRENSLAQPQGRSLGVRNKQYGLGVRSKQYDLGVWKKQHDLGVRKKQHRLGFRKIQHHFEGREAGAGVRERAKKAGRAGKR
jgi:hypothetical protein